MSSIESDILRVDKNDWYTTDIDGNKYWIKSLVDKFWEQLFKVKIDLNDYNFNGIVFPSFSSDTYMKLDLSRNYLKNHLVNPQNPKFNSILGKSDSVVIRSKVDFIDCLFLGHCHFQHFIFEEQVHFRNCTFDDEVRFQENVFKNFFGFRKCKYQGETFFFDNKIFKSFHINDDSSFSHRSIFIANYFGDRFSIGECDFNESVNISKTTFLGRAEIQSSVFNSDLDFFENDLLGGFYLVNPSFYRKASLKDLKMNRGTFQELNFSGTRYIFDNIKLLDNSVLNFNNCNFDKNLLIKDCNLYDFRFNWSDISSVKFLSCNWNIRNRIILREEERMDKKNISSLTSLEDKYRQLKYNFGNVQDWELAGLAYVSEMKMREKRLYLEKDYFSIFIYKIYDYLSGYTQSFKMPLSIFIILTFIIFPFYYIFFETCQNINSDYSCFMCTTLEGYQKSLSASFPFISTDLVYENWWMKSLQSFLSLLLITFFVLALRKRFKQ